MALASTLAAWAGRGMPGSCRWPPGPSCSPRWRSAWGPRSSPSCSSWRRRARALGTWVALVRGFELLADGLDPSRTPGLVLVLAVSAARLPFLSRSVEHGWGRFRPAPVDAAHTLGATPRQARRVATGLRFGASPAALFLTFTLAATNLAPALLLAPTPESRPLAPAVLILADAPGDALAHAAALACAAVALNLVALALAGASHRSAWAIGSAADGPPRSRPADRANSSGPAT